MILSDYGRTIRSVASGFVEQMFESGLTPLSVIMAALSPMAFAVVVIAEYGQVTGVLLLGCLVAGLWGGLHAHGALIILRERSQGTLQLLAATPNGFASSLFGKLLAAACQSMVGVPIITLVIIMLFGTIRDFISPIFFAAFFTSTAGIIGMTCVTMGLLARHRYSYGMINGLFGMGVLFGGFFVPVSAMPLAVRWISSAMPSRWAIEAARPTAIGRWSDLVIGGFLAVAWLSAGVLYLSTAQRHLRKSALYHQ